MTGGPAPKYAAVVFDLLTALEDSWIVWNAVAGDADLGQRWRQAYLRLTYGAGVYRAYESIVAEAAHAVGLPDGCAEALVARWDEIEPWPEARAVLEALKAHLPIGVVTNCSEALGARAAARVGVPFDVVVTAERAGFYKPHPRPYRLALRELGCPAARTLFVAGSPFDVPGASGVGMPVVWHNRIGLPATDAAIRPLATFATLTPIVEETLGTRTSGSMPACT